LELQLSSERSFRFTDFLVRQPAMSVVNGLRDVPGADPDAALFQRQHAAYIDALKESGGNVTILPQDEAFADSVFIEDAALCVGNTAISLRPGAPSRRGESTLLEPQLRRLFDDVIPLPGTGLLDGGDVLLSDNDAFIGLSERTDMAGFDALASVLSGLDYRIRKVETPAQILHFKTDCGLLDSETIFSTARLSETGCFEGYRVITAPEGEETAANLIRVNDTVLLSAGYPLTEELLRQHGYNVRTLDTSEAAKVDGGLSCMSLRFRL
jgi:dimethylargininase